MRCICVYLFLPLVICNNNKQNVKQDKNMNDTVSCDGLVRYADDANEDPLDEFFNNNLVVITHSVNKKIITTGIFIDFHLILTTYSPFHKYRSAGKPLSHFKVCILRERIYDERNKRYVFTATEHNPVCARQIIPYTRANERNRRNYIGKNYTFSPAHDLMVIRLVPTEYCVRAPYSGEYDAALGFTFPEPVHVAKPHYGIENGYATIGSLGFRDLYHLDEAHTLLSRTLNLEGVLEDCDEWLPRWWGHFICIKNIDNYPGLASGSFLVHEGALFGVGCFMLTKTNHTILVFTDLRKYHRMLGTPCHEFEATALECYQGYDRDTFWYYQSHPENRWSKQYNLPCSWPHHVKKKN